MSDNSENSDNNLVIREHIKFLKRYLCLLPAHWAAQDTARLTIGFFTLSGLDILNALDDSIVEGKKNVIDWIYRLQITPSEHDTEESWKHCGFVGCSALLFPQEERISLKPYLTGHIAMTYTGLACLLILGDDLSRVNRPAVIAGVRALQQPDGSFCSLITGTENDMRFVYCAACVCYILNDWTGMDTEKTIQYIRQSMNYDNGIGSAPGLESHGGPTYCAIASLSLMGQLENAFSKEEIQGLTKWCLMRQVNGFQGRPNKPVDTCYSFWIGATLKLLGAFDLCSHSDNRESVLSTQDRIIGGFSKWVDSSPDPMHTYLGLCGLSILKEPDLLPIHAGLNVSIRAHEHLKTLHKMWSCS